MVYCTLRTVFLFKSVGGSETLQNYETRTSSTHRPLPCYKARKDAHMTQSTRPNTDDRLPQLESRIPLFSSGVCAAWLHFCVSLICVFL